MKINLHNKVEIFNGKKSYVFYNTMIESVFDAFESLSAFNEFVAVGIGEYADNEKMQKLSKFIKKYDTNTEIMQNNIENGTLFVKKNILINGADFDNEYITEIGLCENKEDNPTIYNFITLISDETPLGILKTEGQDILINLYIYLQLSAESQGLICEGKNKLISFLLGSGLDEKIYAARGHNLSENVSIKREGFEAEKKYEATISFSKNEGLEISFDFDLGMGETDEIVFMIGDSMVARINVLEQKTPEAITQNFVSKESKIIDLCKDIKSIQSVTNVNQDLVENDYYFVNYASEFGDKVLLPFSRFFDFQTPRFLSKDGKLLFFVKDDYVYGYKNENYQIKEIITGNIFLQNIKKIISFDNFVFAISNFKPFIYCFEIRDNLLEKISIDLSSFEYYESLETQLNIDISMSKAGKLMLSVILENGNGVTAYFYFDEEFQGFIYDSCLLSEYEFSYLISMHKNNYSDACTIFVKGGEYSYECRMVTHFSDKTLRDVATVLAYDLTKDTREIYAKGRAVVVEKTTAPKVYIYYYPELDRYNLSLIESEEDDYFSSELTYLIQKLSDQTYKVYNLIGYNEPQEFASKLSNFVDESKILGLEFMKDTLIVFLDDMQSPVVGINLKENCAAIENVLAAVSEYQVEYERYNKIGKGNEGVKAKLSLFVSI